VGVPPPLIPAELREARAEALPELVSVPSRPVGVGKRCVGVATSVPAEEEDGEEVNSAGEGVEEAVAPEGGLRVDAGETEAGNEGRGVPEVVPLPDKPPEKVGEVVLLAERVPALSLLRGVPVDPSTRVAVTVAVRRSGVGVVIEEGTTEGVDVWEGVVEEVGEGVPLARDWVLCRSGDTVLSAVAREEKEGEREIREEKEALWEAKEERLVDGDKEVEDEKDGDRVAPSDILPHSEREGEVVGEGVKVVMDEMVGELGVLDTVKVVCGESVSLGDEDLVDKRVKDTAGDLESLRTGEVVRDRRGERVIDEQVDVVAWREGVYREVGVDTFAGEGDTFVEREGLGELVTRLGE
jgi:hypothetical protein